MKTPVIYTSVCIPKELAREIDEKTIGKGYRSRAEFILHAVRKELSQVCASEQEQAQKTTPLGGA